MAYTLPPVNDYLACSCLPSHISPSAILAMEPQELYQIPQKHYPRCVKAIQNRQQVEKAQFIRRAEALVAAAFKKQDEVHEQQARLAAERQQALRAEEARKEHAQQAEAKALAEAFACRRCPAKFPSNTKLHEHIRNHHTKKPSAAAPIPPVTPSVTPVTSPKLSWAAIAFIPATLKPSRLPIPISKAPAGPTLASCAPPTPPQTPLLQQRPVLQPPAKAHLTIHDLFAMFDGKPPRKSMNTIQISPPSPSSRQTRITAYFKPATPKLLSKPSANQSAGSLKPPPPHHLGFQGSRHTNRPWFSAPSISWLRPGFSACTACTQALRTSRYY